MRQCLSDAGTFCAIITQTDRIGNRTRLSQVRDRKGVPQELMWPEIQCTPVEFAFCHSDSNESPDKPDKPKITGLYKYGTVCRSGMPCEQRAASLNYSSSLQGVVYLAAIVAIVLPHQDGNVKAIAYCLLGWMLCVFFMSGVCCNQSPMLFR